MQHGIVRGAEEVTLDSHAPQGALIGGAIGLLAGRGDSRAGNAIRGATLGGAATAIGEGSRTGMSYTVELPKGQVARVVTDQREIRVGDCVAVERVGRTANIRRVSESYCDPSNQIALAAIDDSVRSRAMACESAKQELVEATTQEQVDLATRKMELLCDG